MIAVTNWLACAWLLIASTMSPAVGAPVTMLSNILPAFIICVGVAGTVHVISVYRDMIGHEVERREAVIRAVASTGKPIVFTTLTTASGLLVPVLAAHPEMNPHQVALIICAAQYEFYQLVRSIPGVGRPHLSGIVAGFALHFGLFFLAAEDARSNYLLTGGALLVGLHLLSLLRHPGEVPTLLRRFPTLYGFAYLPFMLASLIAIARMKDGHLLTAQSVGLYYVVWVFVATKFTDVGGLMIGVPFGKHKIAPTISPAKSWEGCLGGLATSAGASALFAWLMRDVFDINFTIAVNINFKTTELSGKFDVVTTFTNCQRHLIWFEINFDAFVVF